MVRKKIVVLGTGGTIAGTAADPGDGIGYTAAQLGVAQLLQALPGQAASSFELVTEQVAQLDSKDMSFQVWRQLALRCAHWLAQQDVQGLVITHGTDTLEETAYFLHAVLGPDKPVVLTCAMRPATSVHADGPQNMLDALAVASLPGAQGVVAVCAGTVHGATDVQKIHTYRLDAFSSGDAGPLGFVEEGVVRLVKQWPEPPANICLTAIEKVANSAFWPRVEILMSYAGADGLVVDALLAQSASDSPGDLRLKGLVLAGTGNGSLHATLEAAASRAQQAGVRVVRASRCCEGRVLMKPGDSLEHTRGLSPVKARVALMLDLL
ncbi:MAG: asparaginase [Gammaproteobacteria bacterium]|nr:asparaginase [Gammaproteobacteria bacterium]MBU0786658.1 asparaginase [Gammaproteobacteria bacterium]MBU0814271.1 asparaginase [Gammaproteobacteria bacterium]MBU1786209.1 asparaginase [Gammaproteobacteria bacterium]